MGVGQNHTHTKSSLGITSQEQNIMLKKKILQQSNGSMKLWMGYFVWNFLKRF